MSVTVQADLSLLYLTFCPSSQGSEAGGKLESGDKEEQHQEKKQGEATHTPSSHRMFPGEAGLTQGTRGFDAIVRVRINFWDWYSNFWQDCICLKICYVSGREVMGHQSFHPEAGQDSLPCVLGRVVGRLIQVVFWLHHKSCLFSILVITAITVYWVLLCQKFCYTLYIYYSIYSLQHAIISIFSIE